MIIQSLIPFIDIPTLFILFSLHWLQLIPVITISPIHWSYCSVLCASPLSVVCCPQRVTVFHIASFINLLMPGLMSLKGVIPPIMVGMYPQLSLNRANPVKLLTFEFMASSVISSWSTQSDWSGWIRVCRFWWKFFCPCHKSQGHLMKGYFVTGILIQ